MNDNQKLMLKKDIVQYLWEDYMNQGWPYRDASYSEIGAKLIGCHLYIGVKDDDISSGLIPVVDLSFSSGRIAYELRYFFNPDKQYITISFNDLTELQEILWKIKENISEGELF